MCGSAHACRENFHGEEEGGAVGTHVQEELGEGEDRNQAAGGGVVEDAGPDGVEAGDDDRAPELGANAAEEVGEEDADVVAGEVALAIRKCQSRAILCWGFGKSGGFRLTADATMMFPTAVFHRVPNLVGALP